MSPRQSFFLLCSEIKIFGEKESSNNEIAAYAITSARPSRLFVNDPDLLVGEHSCLKISFTYVINHNRLS